MKSKRARYICVEGTEGVGKTTQTQKLVDHLREKGFKVLQTKEPGTNHAPLTMMLRGVMLDAQYDGQLTRPARELISQAIRSIHLENVIKPALAEYDFIVQDRGILSGLSYGEACGNTYEWLEDLVYEVLPPGIADDPYTLYDSVVYLTGDVRKGLETALSSKQEFTAGDSIEKKGLTFMEKVNTNMQEYASIFGASEISVDGKSIDKVFSEILNALKLENTSNGKG